jgi:GNAT superfamily N-acetyltransferase
MSKQQVRLIEELAANAWPAESVQYVDGWRLRHSTGSSRRVNSVWPNLAGGTVSLEERLGIVEDFYARHGGVARYQITPAAQPDDLEAILRARGYQDDARTAVQRASLKAMLARTTSYPDGRISIAPQFTEQWFTAYCEAEGYGPDEARVRRGIFERIGPATGFVLLAIESKPAAIGLGVTERGWLGVFCMITFPDYRRQGAASAVLHALAEWGQGHGAEQVYLQVMENNPPGKALYAKAGFETLYYYYYLARELS